MIAKTHKPAVLLLPPPKGVRNEVIRFFGPVLRLITPWLTLKHTLLVAGAGCIALIAGYTTAFLWPHNIVFSYAGDNCFTQPLLLPRLISHNSGATHVATPRTSLSIGGYPIYSHTTCVTPSSTPQEHATDRVAFGSGPFTKNIRVTTAGFPALASQSKLKAPVPTQDPLVLELSSSDAIFEYRLVANNQKTMCNKRSSRLTCDVGRLGLAQSANYELKIEQLFRQAPAKVLFAGPIATVESVHITAASIGAGQTVYEVPTELTLTFNRDISIIGTARLYLVNGDTRQEVATSASLANKIVTVHFAQPLARNSTFLLALDAAKASDGGYLPEPFNLSFKTSGGPKVVGASIGSYKVPTAGNIALTFDAPLSKTQNLQEFIRLEVAGTAVAIQISAQGKKLTIQPQGALPRCTALTLKVLDGLQNDFGISGGSAWTLTSRTICQAVSSIGTSVQGRSILAYSFGSGPSKIIFVGTTHGDEKSSTYLLNSWIDYLERNYASIPAHRTIIVIPSLNPDGYAASRRTNAHNVDLNRNFPTNDWKQGVTMPDQTYNPNGGGSAPLSEPESAALANYVQAQAPRLVLTYHAAAGVVIPNDSGDSESLAHTYDQKSNVGYTSNGETDTTFQYDTNGAFEDWLHDGPDLPALLVELWTKSGNEFSKHQTAMLAMIQLP